MTLVGLFVGLGAIFFVLPQQSQDYINVRYKALYNHFIEHTPVSKILAGNAIGGLSEWAIRLHALPLALAGLFALFGFKKLFMCLSLHTLVIATLLHLPISSPLPALSFIAQTRKLMLIFALLCGTFAFVCEQGSNPVAEEKKEESKPAPA